MSAPAYEVVAIGSLKAADDNVRTEVGDVSDLADSIKTSGLLQPILVDMAGQVVAGSRRLAAAKAAGLKDVPVLKKAFSDQERLEAMLVENLQREDLSPIEEADGFRRLAELGLSQRQIAERVGRSQSHVSKHLALLALPEAVQKQVENGGISMPDAHELSKLKAVPDVIEKVAKSAKQQWGPSVSTQVQTELKRQEKAKARTAAFVALLKKDGNAIDLDLDEHGYRVELPEGTKEVQKEAFTAEYVEMDPKKHAKEECHAVFLNARNEPVELCTKPDNHPSKAASIKAERQKAREKAKKSKEAFDASTARRMEFVTSLIKGRLNTDVVLEIAYVALVKGSAYAASDEYELAYDLLGLEKPGEDVAAKGQIDWAELLDVEAAKSATARNRALLAFAIATFEVVLTEHGHWGSQRPYFEWLVSRGYALDAIEKRMVGQGGVN